MKKLFFILFCGLLLTSSIGAVKIESVVYDFKVSQGKLEGLSLMVIRADEKINEITFSCSDKVTLINEKVNYEKENSAITLKNLSLGKGDQKNIALRFESKISSQDIAFPLFKFPYVVEKTLVGVEESRDKFVWKIDFPAYTVQGNDKVLAQGRVGRRDIEELDELMLELKKSHSKDENLPSYRVYLGEIKPNNEVMVRGWSGKSYQFYLPNVIPVIIISCALLLVLYFILKRPAFSIERKEELKKEKKEVQWPAIKEKCQENLEKLKGDEKELYQEIFNQGGEILQRDLPERLEFSKAKVSRILDSLERKGLVERKSYGVTNKVVLK